MYLSDFEEFLRQSEELYRAEPLQTRFSTKYRHRDGALVLKVTDDVRCLKFQTDQTADLKKVETVTALFLSLMARGMDTPYDDLLTLPPSAAAAGGAGKGGKGGGGKGKGGGSRKG